MEDNLDIRYSKDSGVNVREVIFLSRHFASSGIPSLTLHVIGVPGESPVGETAEFGGIKGEVVPPNTRFAEWYRRMYQAGTEHGLIPEFDMTIETTHHGPSLSVPTIGFTNNICMPRCIVATTNAQHYFLILFFIN